MRFFLREKLLRKSGQLIWELSAEEGLIMSNEGKFGEADRTGR
jgi:hypothetical protein